LGLMRLARIKVEGESAVYHCISRIVGGQYLLEEEEKEKLRRLIWDQARFCGVEVITYCVMSNHFHLLVRVPEQTSPTDSQLIARARVIYGKRSLMMQNLQEDMRVLGHVSRVLRENLESRMGDISMYMKELKMRLSKWYNKKHGRYGTIWAERFKSVLVEDEPSAVRTVAGYIELNPVRAGLVEDPKDYRYCGYAEALVGNGEARSGIMSFYGERSWKKVSEEYRQFLYIDAGVSGSSEKKAMDRETIKRVMKEGGRLSTGEILRLKIRYLTDGVVIGSKEYVEGKFEVFRDRFGSRRQSGSRPVRGLELGGLRAMRDLKVSAVT